MTALIYNVTWYRISEQVDNLRVHPSMGERLKHCLDNRTYSRG